MRLEGALFALYKFEGLACGGDGGCDFSFHGRCLGRRLRTERAGPDALIQHGAMEAAEGGGVRFRGFFVVGDWIGREEPGTHGAYAVGGERDAGQRLRGYAFENGFRVLRAG